MYLAKHPKGQNAFQSVDTWKRLAMQQGNRQTSLTFGVACDIEPPKQVHSLSLQIAACAPQLLILLMFNCAFSAQSSQCFLKGLFGMISCKPLARLTQSRQIWPTLFQPAFRTIKNFSSERSKLSKQQRAAKQTSMRLGPAMLHISAQ